MVSKFVRDRSRRALWLSKPVSQLWCQKKVDCYSPLAVLKDKSSVSLLWWPWNIILCKLIHDQYIPILLMLTEQNIPVVLMLTVLNLNSCFPTLYLLLFLCNRFISYLTLFSKKSPPCSHDTFLSFQYQNWHPQKCCGLPAQDCWSHGFLQEKIKINNQHIQHWHLELVVGELALLQSSLGLCGSGWAEELPTEFWENRCFFLWKSKWNDRNHCRWKRLHLKLDKYC